MSKQKQTASLETKRALKPPLQPWSIEKRGSNKNGEMD